MKYRFQRPSLWNPVRATAIGTLVLISFGCSIKAADDKALEAIFEIANQLGNHVISCRDVIDNWGNLISEDKRGSWTASRHR